MPAVLQDMADGALQALAVQHVSALVAGVLALEDGSSVLAELMRASGAGVTPRVMFLRQCAAGWERAKSSDFSRIVESAAPLEAMLREQPWPDVAQQLAALVRETAVLTRPPREAARVVGLPHEPSLDARRRWHTVALDLNNRLDAIPEAVTVFEALVSGFDDPDDLHAKMVSNLQICRERVTAGEGTAEIKRLRKAIAAATAEPEEFDQCGLVDGRKTSTCRPIVAELYDSFVAAAEPAKSDLPWLMLRTLSLLLHNQHGATSAAWSLTLLAITQANKNNAATTMLPLLFGDRRDLREQILQRDLSVASRSKNKSLMRTILTELLSVVDGAKERAEYEKQLRGLRSQAVVSFLKWGSLAGFGLLMVIGALNTPAPPVPVATAPVRVQPTSAIVPLADRTALQPPAGNTAPLSIYGLRWCRYQAVRANGAETYLNKLRQESSTQVDRFNAAVNTFNAYVRPMNESCARYSYNKEDGLIIDAEVSEQQTVLAYAGQQVVESVYLAGSAGSTSASLFRSNPSYFPPSSTTPLTPSSDPRPSYVAPPAQAIQPAAPVTGPYADGQSDRRAWEAWMGSTTGATHDGAEWWAGVRSVQRPPSCSTVPGGNDPPAALAGCNQAKTRLANSDRRRRAEPDYRAGWNNP